MHLINVHAYDGPNGRRNSRHDYSSSESARGVTRYESVPT